LPEEDVLLRRSWITLLVIGGSLAAALTFAVVPAVTALYAAHHGFGGAVEPWIIDGGSLVANAALLVALFRLRQLVGESPAGEEDMA
jgi:hypothetical protein